MSEKVYAVVSMSGRAEVAADYDLTRFEFSPEAKTWVDAGEWRWNTGPVTYAAYFTDRADAVSLAKEFQCKGKHSDALVTVISHDRDADYVRFIYFTRDL